MPVINDAHQILSVKDIYQGMRDEIFGFTAMMVEKYKDYQGSDHRRKLSHLMEQAGLLIHSEIEREIQRERDKVRAENMAAIKVGESVARDVAIS